MAKDDYFVIAYRILAYLYACLKEGEQPDAEYLTFGTPHFPIGQAYWDYIMLNLANDGYIIGVTAIRTIGHAPAAKIGKGLCITPKGIEYLLDNGMIQKAKSLLKDLKEIVPGF